MSSGRWFKQSSTGHGLFYNNNNNNNNNNPYIILGMKFLPFFEMERRMGRRRRKKERQEVYEKEDLWDEAEQEVTEMWNEYSFSSARGGAAVKGQSNLLANRIIDCSAMEELKTCAACW